MLDWARSDPAKPLLDQQLDCVLERMALLAQSPLRPYFRHVHFTVSLLRVPPNDHAIQQCIAT